MDALFYAFVVFLFAAAVLAIEGVYLWWVGTHGAAARRIARRLQVMSGSPGRSGERISILKQRPYSRNVALDRILHQVPLAHRIDALLVQAGAVNTVGQFLAWSLGSMAAAGLLSFAWPLPAPLRMLVALLGLCVPWFLLRRARQRRLLLPLPMRTTSSPCSTRWLRRAHRPRPLWLPRQSPQPARLRARALLRRSPATANTPCSNASAASCACCTIRCASSATTRR